MKTKMQSSVLLIAAVLFATAPPLLSDTNRPQCGIDSNGSGVCFVNGEAPIPIWLICTDDLPDVEVGYWEIGDGHNDFLRFKMDGSIFVHNSESEVFATFCSPETIAGGYCNEGGEGWDADEWYTGFVTWQANGMLDHCPFVMTSRGEVTRYSDGDTLQVHMKYQTVVDESSPTGCRISKCQIFKPGQFETD